MEGTFFRTDDEAYQDAWCKLNDRYGQPFVIQKAFRERLANWPKIHSNYLIGQLADGIVKLHHLSDDHEYPTIKEFSMFVSTEAEIDCNPVTSFHALHNSELAVEKVNLKETKKSKVWVLIIQSSIESQDVVKSLNKAPFCPKNNLIN